jgi:hypothetical protein
MLVNNKVNKEYSKFNIIIIDDDTSKVVWIVFLVYYMEKRALSELIIN